MWFLVSVLSTAFATGPVSDAVDASVVQQLDAIPGEVTDGWDDAAQSILVGSYDLDHSGTIDTDVEIDALPCNVWEAVDRGVHRAWDNGLYVIYGFGPEFGWVGYAVGFDEGQRERAASALGACGFGPSDSHPRTVVTGAAPIADNDDGGGSGSEDDDAMIEARLLHDYDTNGSGELSKKEAKTIPCGVLQEIDRTVRARWDGSGVRVIHGFDKDMIWVGYALGFARETRGLMHKRLVACDVER